ncbi:hypothetical protein COB57_04280 [Candidatus Peregrinibacteria bacterium]|nr:MAG: hypothetical protein COB57_04280 [Candidatus Peregrinibacteria bacterium]
MKKTILLFTLSFIMSSCITLPEGNIEKKIPEEMYDFVETETDEEAYYYEKPILERPELVIEEIKKEPKFISEYKLINNNRFFVLEAQQKNTVSCTNEMRFFGGSQYAPTIGCTLESKINNFSPEMLERVNYHLERMQASRYIAYVAHLKSDIGYGVYDFKDQGDVNRDGFLYESGKNTNEKIADVDYSCFSLGDVVCPSLILNKENIFFKVGMHDDITEFNLETKTIVMSKRRFQKKGQEEIVFQINDASYSFVVKYTEEREEDRNITKQSVVDILLNGESLGLIQEPLSVFSCGMGAYDERCDIDNFETTLRVKFDTDMFVVSIVDNVLMTINMKTGEKIIMNK